MILILKYSNYIINNCITENASFMCNNKNILHYEKKTSLQWSKF